MSSPRKIEEKNPIQDYKNWLIAFKIDLEYVSTYEKKYQKLSKIAASHFKKIPLETLNTASVELSGLDPKQPAISSYLQSITGKGLQELAELCIALSKQDKSSYLVPIIQHHCNKLEEMTFSMLLCLELEGDEFRLSEYSTVMDQINIALKNNTNHTPALFKKAPATPDGYVPLADNKTENDEANVAECRCC